MNCAWSLLTALAVSACAAPALAADERAFPAERLERLERRINEIAERQEQMMRTFGAQMEHPGVAARPGNENFHPPNARAGNDSFQPPPQAPGGPVGGMMRPAEARNLEGLHHFLGMLFLVGVVCNVLMAVWIYTDIRKRGEGSGIFVAMALLAGIPAALIYAVTRLGDKKP